MARVTVEDCLNHVDNRFQLVLIATRRSRELANGKEAMLEWENNKPTVVALREIADGLVGREILDAPEEPEPTLELAAGEAEGEEAPAEGVQPAAEAKENPEQP